MVTHNEDSMTYLNGNQPKAPLPEKSTLLLLHPGGVMHSVWLPFMRQWSDEYRIIAPDLYLLKADPFTIKALAQAVIDVVMQHEQIQTVTIIGSSLGANVALQIAVQQPDWVKSLVLDSAQAGGEPVPPVVEKVIAGLHRVGHLIPNALFARLMMSQFNAYKSQDWAAVYHEIRLLGVRGFVKAVQATFAHNVRADLIQIRVPVLLTNGERDPVLADSTRLLYNLPHAEQFIISEAGHSACLSQHSAFLDKVNAFLRAHR
jgi:2-succinyl-6-hydroxy-2,4-cyclohexadiene-1-carboxylate synthase